MTDKLPDPEFVNWFTRVLGADEILSDFGSEEPGAGGYCEVGKDKEEELNATELGILKVGINKMIVNCYADIQRQSLEELSDKLDRIIDEANKENEALALWKRWFEYSGFPWIDKEAFLCHCFFCTQSEPNHEPDCIYVAAKELVEDDSIPD